MCQAGLQPENPQQSLWMQRLDLSSCCSCVERIFRTFSPPDFSSSCDRVKALYNGLQWTLDKVCAVVACIPGKLYYVLLQGVG